LIKFAHRAYVNVPRLLVVACTTLAYVSLLCIDMSDTFQGYPVKAFPFSTWLSFGLAELIGLLFFLVGTLVWLYARDRVVALLLYAFSYAIAVAFILQTATFRNNTPVFNIVTAITSISAVLCLALFMLMCPVNHLKLRKEQVDEEEKRELVFSSVVKYYAYISLLVVLGVIVSIGIAVFGMQRQHFPLWLTTMEFLYYIIGLSGILFFVFFSYIRAASPQVRQQLRLFMYGTLASVSPFLLLTILPTELHLSSQYIVGGQYSTISLCIFPFTLSYAVLRHQLLHFDAYARRFVLWATGLISLVFLAYIMVAICQLFFHGRISPYMAAFILVTALLAPSIWGLSKKVTERVLFSEIAHYRRAVEQLALLSGEAFDLDEVARLFTLAAVDVFETEQACLFVLDESVGSFRIYPPLREDAADAPRRNLVDAFLRVLGTHTPASGIERYSAGLSAQWPALKIIAASSFPLLLHEVVRTNDRERRLIDRYLPSLSPLTGEDILLAPVKVQGRLIGVLMLGSRGEHQQYTGPDFEIAQLLASRFASFVDNARWYLRANQHSALLNGLSKVGAPLSDTFQSINDVAEVYASVATEATSARAEIWLCDEERYVLRRQVIRGSGPCITEADTLRLGQEYDWSPVFYDGSDSAAHQQNTSALLTCLPEVQDFPFAWLPLLKNEQNIGVLVLAYAYPHSFMKEEARVLELFARQCATALENARITLELRQAYERLKELDQLKDQFIATASHELRTPLTAVQGYIELLNEYNETLDTVMRGDFITKAKRSCEELSLLVDNIMDASHVYADAKNMFLHDVLLHAAITHVLDILEGIIVREERAVEIDVPDELMVYADSTRLRQVLLNLLSNALKYSPSGSDLHITATTGDCLVTVRVRDYGSGVPIAVQSQLFQRFVRMERDMNSPVRGAGLGLFISRQLIEAMGGQLWVESEGIPGRGSTFIFTLRCKGPYSSTKV
jgi:signal transduction histidine kinase